MTKKQLPFVSICTPTFNRRPFIPFIIKCFENQTYPRDRMEWIIVDDGTDPIEDLVKDLPYVKYFYSKEKMYLGKKRNFMHSKCSGSIIVYMDDDDYYPPERVSHAVETLKKNPRVQIAGSSMMHIYFNDLKQMYTFGPYGANHATAATFAFRKELLQKCKYDNDAALAEERNFLKGHTIPMAQLDSTKTILVFSHSHNTYDKKDMLTRLNETRGKLVSTKVEDFVKEQDILQFFTVDIIDALKNYELGKIENKPNLIQKIEETKEKNEKIKKDIIDFANIKQKIMSSFGDNKAEIDALKQDYEKKIYDKTMLINQLLTRVKSQTEIIEELKKTIDELKKEQ
jgi:glycosyltransferase involved in cell wall biosynthesis